MSRCLWFRRAGLILTTATVFLFGGVNLDRSGGHPRAVHAAKRNDHPVVIHTDGALSTVIAAVIDSGGTVRFQYPYLNAVAADVPLEGLQDLADLAGNIRLIKDAPIPAPAPVRAFDARGGAIVSEVHPLDHIPTTGMLPISALGIDLATFAELHPDAYQINHLHDGVRQLHAQGITGDGTVVAVVDTGYRPGFGFVDDSRIVGCVSVLPFDPVGCAAEENDGHGTFVAGVLAGQGIFRFNPATSVFAHSVAAFAPGAGLDLDGDGFGESVVLLGSAPNADVFVVKAFVDAFTPSPSSVILAAVDEILRAHHDGMKIRVANLSLGTFTLFPGGSVLDLAVEALLDVGIIPVASAGNTGPAILTAASPASSRAAIAVGAGSAAHQERIAADVGFFQTPGFGAFLRVDDDAQTAWFSARGPHADGRTAPDVVADGWVIGSGLGATPDSISIGSGTSFAAPAVSGIAALLSEAQDQGLLAATADEVRNALASSGDDGVVPGASPLDHGTGWVDAMRAFEILAGTTSEKSAPASSPPPQSVRQAIRESGVRIAPAVVRNREIVLGPGDRIDLVYDAQPNLSSLEFRVRDVRTAPGCIPNRVFGEDEIRLAIHEARTSAFPPRGFYVDLNPGPPLHGFISPNDLDNPAAPGMLPGACGDGACRVTMADPEPGLIRFSLNGATENACAIQAVVDIDPVFGPPSPKHASGKISHGDFHFGTIQVPSGIQNLKVGLSWHGDWSAFPSNDLDLFLVDPYGNFTGNGSTLDSPEIISVSSPAAGIWTYAVFGFEVNDAPDHWELGVEVDGRKLRN